MTTTTGKDREEAAPSGVHGNGGTVRLGKAGSAVHGGMLDIIGDAQRIESELVQLVRTAVSDALHAGGAVATDMTEVARDVTLGAISAVEQVGTGLAMSMKTVSLSKPAVTRSEWNIETAV